MASITTAPVTGASTAAEVVEAEEAWPSRGRAWYTIWLIAFVTLLSNIDRSIINLLVEPMKRDLVLTDTQVSLIIGMAFSLFYLLTGFPMSRVSDVRSRKWVLAGGLIAWSAATAACGFARTFTQMFIARGVVGAAESLPGPASMSMISDLVPREKLPRAFAIYQLGIGFGQNAALIIGGLLLAFFAGIDRVVLPIAGEMAPWEMVFFCCGVPGLLVAVLWIVTVKDPVRRGRKHKGTVPFKEVVRYLRAHRSLYLPMFASVAIGAIEIMGASAWRPAMFERTYGWTPAFIGPLYGTTQILLMPVSLIAGTLLAEHLLKRNDPRAMLRVSVIASSLSLPLIVVAPLMPNPWACFALMIIGMMMHGMAAPALNSAIQFVTPNEFRAQVSSLYLYTVSVVGTWCGPLIIGLISDFVLKDPAMLRYAMSGFALVLGPFAIACMWLAMNAYGRVMEERAAAQ